jgi:hypothetical protein
MNYLLSWRRKKGRYLKDNDVSIPALQEGTTIFLLTDIIDSSTGKKIVIALLLYREQIRHLIHEKV